MGALVHDGRGCSSETTCDIAKYNQGMGFNYKLLTAQLTCSAAYCRFAPNGVQNDSRGFHAVSDGNRIAAAGAAVGPVVTGDSITSFKTINPW
jgi:hypothetical protein